MRHRSITEDYLEYATSDEIDFL